VNPENKMMLMAYGIFAIAGIISGILGAYAPLGWIIGWIIYILAPKLLLNLVPDLPEELRNERVILRKTFWSFFFFWLYFTGLTYTLITNYEPVAYYEKALYYNITKG